MASFKTLDDLTDISGKRVLVRVDLNVPCKDGKVTDATRIERVAPTILELSDKGAKVILSPISAAPRTAGSEFSLAVIQSAVEAVLDRRVHFASDCIGAPAARPSPRLKTAASCCSKTPASTRAKRRTIRISSRPWPPMATSMSTTPSRRPPRARLDRSLAHHLPAYAGRTMQAELEALEPASAIPSVPSWRSSAAPRSRPRSTCSRISSASRRAVIGGGMANTFLAAQGINVGKSLCEHDLADTAKAILAEAQDAGCAIVLPSDVVVAREFKANAANETVAATAIPATPWRSMSARPRSRRSNDWIAKAENAGVNGPLGAFEIEPFDTATVSVAKSPPRKPRPASSSPSPAAATRCRAQPCRRR